MAITGKNIILKNEEALRARLASGTATEVLKLDASDVLKVMKLPRLDAAAGAPSNAKDLVTKEYADSAISTGVLDLVGAPSGIASLDLNGKVPVAQLPNSIMQYQGMFDAATGAPALVNGAGNSDESIGDVWRVSVAGDYDFGAGALSLAVGDYVILNGSKVWERSHSTDVDPIIADLQAEDLTFLKLNGSRPMTGALDLGLHAISGVTQLTADSITSDGAPLSISATGGNNVEFSSPVSLIGAGVDLDLGGNDISGVGTVFTDVIQNAGALSIAAAGTVLTGGLTVSGGLDVSAISGLTALSGTGAAALALSNAGQAVSLDSESVVITTSSPGGVNPDFIQFATGEVIFGGSPMSMNTSSGNISWDVNLGSGSGLTQSFTDTTVGSDASISGTLTADGASSTYQSLAADVFKLFQTDVYGLKHRASDFSQAETYEVAMSSDFATASATILSKAVIANTPALLKISASEMSLQAAKITDLADPTDAQDAATKAYVDSVAAGIDTAAELSFNTVGSFVATNVQAALEELDAEKMNWAGGTMSGGIDMGGFGISNAGSLQVATITDITSIAGAGTLVLSALSGDIDVNISRIINMSDPLAADHAATKGYVDAEDATFLKFDGSRAMTGPLDMSLNGIEGVSAISSSGAGGVQVIGEGVTLLDPTAAPFASLTGDAIAFEIASNGVAQLNLVSASGLVGINSEVSMEAHKITNLVDPTGAQDAATKAFVDQAEADANAYTDAQLDTLSVFEQAFKAVTLSAGQITAQAVSVDFPIVGTPWIQVNGRVMLEPGVDFTFAGSTITFAGVVAVGGEEALAENDRLAIFYHKSVSPFV